MDPWTALPLLFGVGVIAGALNTIAGGGSFLTLPALIFLGLPAGVANGTNRIGVLVQSIVATWSFDRHDLLDRHLAPWATVPALVGAAGGTSLALVVGDTAFERILAVLMVVISLISFYRPTPRDRPALGGGRRLALAMGFTLVGVYNGFVQAGAGFLILAATTFAGLDLVRGNALKVFTVACTTLLSLILFALAGRVDWGLGLALAVGMSVGARLGARWTMRRGHRWVRAVVTVTVVVFAIRLWLA
ncbi:MAG: TSUP family transporter [Acidobacteriota bacterium]